MAMSLLCAGIHAPSAFAQTAPDEFVVERTFFRATVDNRTVRLEGLIVKRLDSTYHGGKAGRDWLKLKNRYRQEFVVGGYTEPRNSREHLGALLLGYYDGDRLIYAGHTGGGFTRQSLADMWHRLKSLERKTPPFALPVPRTNEHPHWVRPSVVVDGQPDERDAADEQADLALEVELLFPDVTFRGAAAAPGRKFVSVARGDRRADDQPENRAAVVTAACA
jgi:hypothetical protein